METLISSSDFCKLVASGFTAGFVVGLVARAIRLVRTTVARSVMVSDLRS